jgi:hypothetical protein
MSDQLVQIIDEKLDTYRYAGLGVIATVAKNIVVDDPERALTYLLGAQDAAGASDNFRLAGLIRDCRNALKLAIR